MQSMDGIIRHRNIYDYYSVIEENSGSQILYRHCVCYKCHKVEDSNTSTLNEISIKNDDQSLGNNITKPCSVLIKKLNLLGHNGSRFSNCCLSFSEKDVGEKSIIINKVGKIEHGDSLAEDESFSKENRDSNRKCIEMNLLYESLCETFSLLRAKKMKSRETKKVDIFSSCNSAKSETKDDPKKLIGTLLQEKNKIFKTSKISKPGVKNSSRTYNISYLPTFESFRKKFDAKENSKNIRYLCVGTDSEIENEAPSTDVKSMQIKYLSSSEAYTNHRTRKCEILKMDSGLLVDRRNNYSVPLVNATSKVYSRFPVKSSQDRDVQARDLSFPLNNSNSCRISNRKPADVENACDKGGGAEIEMIELETQTNAKRTAENSVNLSNHKTESIEEVDSTVSEKSEGKKQILKESLVARKFKERETKKHLEGKALVNENSDEYENKEWFEADDSAGNKHLQNLDKSVKPCSVLIEIMDEKLINFYCNRVPVFLKDDANDYIPQMETSVQLTPLTKPCSVIIEKLSFDECLKFINPSVVKSFCNGNASYRNVKTEPKSVVSEEKSTRPCKMNVCFPSPDCSAIIDAVPNVDAVSKLAVIKGQTRRDPKKRSLVKPCCVVIQRLSIDERFLPRKSSIRRQYSFLKKIMAFSGGKSFLHRRNMLIKCNILNKVCLNKFNKKWGKRPKALKQIAEEGKDFQTNLNFTTNNGVYADKISSNLLRESERICSTSSCSSSNLATKECFVLLERMNVDEYVFKNKKIFYNRHGLKRNSSDVSYKCPFSDFRTLDCSVRLERINLDEWFSKKRNIFNQCDLSVQSENLPTSRHGIRNKYNRYKKSVPISRLKLKRRSLKAEDTSKLDVKKLKRTTDYSTGKPAKYVKTFYNSSNLICDSDYKCVQCRKSITSDFELYHHLCCGKRKKGYICDICEKIFETIPRHQKHVNYHYKFISSISLNNNIHDHH